MSIRFHCKCGRQFRVPDNAAGKRAKCLDCGQTLVVPFPRQPAGAPATAGQPAAADAPATSRPATPQRAGGRPAAPAARPTAPPARPARPAASPADDVPVARLASDDVPMARLAAVERTRPAYQAPLPLGAVRVAVGIAVVVMLVCAGDVIISVGKGVRGGVRGMGMMHVGWLAGLLIGLFVAVAAARGSRLCIGILLGGACQNVIFNGPALLVASQMDFVKRLGDWTSKGVLLVGFATLAVGAVQLVLLLLGPHVKKHLPGHGGAVAGGAVGGFLFGGLAALTAMPNAGFVATHILAQPDAVAGIALAAKNPNLLDAQEKKNLRARMHNQLAQIHSAFQAYVYENENFFPADLGVLVGKEKLKAENFLAPGSQKPPPARDEKTGAFKGPTDIIYVMTGYNLNDLPDKPEVLAHMVVMHWDPSCLFGEGAVVMRPPGSNTELVQWVDKGLLEEELSYTRKWMKDNPPVARPKAGEALPPLPE